MGGGEKRKKEKGKSRKKTKEKEENQKNTQPKSPKSKFKPQSYQTFPELTNCEKKKKKHLGIIYIAKEIIVRKQV